MQLRVGWIVLFACAALLIVGGPVQAQSQIFDPAWLRTSNQAAGNASTMGVPAKEITDTYWTWTSTVWDGPSTIPGGRAIPNYVPGDFWAKWLLPSGTAVVQQWLKTTLDLPACTVALLDEVRLIDKYTHSPGQILGINDDLYVWVNGEKAAAGGTAPGEPTVHVDSSWADKFSAVGAWTDSLETDGWWIPNGLVLPKEQFQAGANQINVLTDDFRNWGGLARVVFKVTQTGPCVNIDIKPGSYPNCFNLNGSGVIPVAILGSSTFDVTQINLSTLSFNGMAVRVKGNGAPQCSLQNVNGDGYADLVCQFVDDPSAWLGGSTTATVKGNLNSGTPFAGSDEICIVP